MRRLLFPLRARLSVEFLEDRSVPSAGIGLYAPGTETFMLRYAANAGAADAGTFKFDTNGMIPVAGDWNGDGKQDFGVFDPKTATWALRYGAEAGPANAGVFKFGTANSIPVVGDWNGDGRSDIGTFNPGTA